MRWLFLSFLFFSACQSGCEKKNDTSVPFNPIHWTECGYEIGDHACDFTLIDQNNESWNLYDNYGKTIVLDFSTEWCGYCHKAAETTQSIQDEYSSAGLIYTTILIEDMAGNSPPLKEAVERWCSHYEITAPVLSSGRELVAESVWGISSWPTFYILNEDLVIIEIIRGYNEVMLVEAIKNALEEN